MTAIKDAIVNFLRKYFTVEVITVIISMIPLIELRGSIPIGIGLGLPYLESVLLSFVGSSIPPIFIIWLIGYIFDILRVIPFMDRLITKINTRVYNKREQIEKYGYLGLILFVGIPLPGTGAWSGSLLAYLLKLDKFKALLSVIVGNAIAAVIMTLLSGALFSIIG